MLKEKDHPKHDKMIEKLINTLINGGTFTNEIGKNRLFSSPTYH
jgi:hypothetical protein